MTISDYIRESGFKKSHIAKTLGINNTTLANKINGRRRWKVDEMNRLSELLGVPIESLVDAVMRKDEE